MKSLLCKVFLGCAIIAAVPSTAPAQSYAFSLLHPFGGVVDTNNTPDGAGPLSAPLQASDGQLYGVTTEGGLYYAGVLWKMDKDGLSYPVLHHFEWLAGSTPDGSSPIGLIEASDGMLYGMTSYGGSADKGTIYRIGKDGTGYRVLFSFSDTNGADPVARLFEASDGRLYGTTYNGGGVNAGVVFGVSTDGSGFNVLHSFESMADGGFPNCALIQGSDQYLYGTATASYSLVRGDSQGSIFKIGTGGGGYQSRGLTPSTYGDPFGYPEGGLVMDSDQNLYGAWGTPAALPGGLFTISNDLSSADMPTVLVYFNINDTNGVGPHGSLVIGADGRFYGTCATGGDNGYGVVFAVQKDGTGYTKLHDFTVDEGWPGCGLSLGSDGIFYGTTYGASNAVGYAYCLKPVYASTAPTNIFLSTNAIPENPPLWLTLASFSTGDADPYDTFYYELVSGAGDYDNNSFYIEGTNLVSYITQLSGAPQVRYSIRVRSTDANGLWFEKQFTLLMVDHPSTDIQLTSASVLENLPAGALVGTFSTMDSDQYDTFSYTLVGGDGSEDNAIFSINGAALVTTTLFTSATRHACNIRIRSTDPQGLFLEKPFIITVLPSRLSNFSTLHTFDTSGIVDGSGPKGVIEGKDGWLYGTTSSGFLYHPTPGDNQVAFYGGTIFKMRKDGSGYQIIHQFQQTDANDGMYPMGHLVQGPDGTLYGTTWEGGAGAVYSSSGNPITYIPGGGILFSIQPNGGGYRILHNFGAFSTDGTQPYDSPLLGSDGALYGTTSYGGASSQGLVQDCGTVFKIQTDGNGYTILHSFRPYYPDEDGQDPYAALIEGRDGALYGSTAEGGKSYGTIFKIQKNGSGYTVLYRFAGAYYNDGESPESELVEDGDGMLYGRTWTGGSWQIALQNENDADGTIFRIQKDGTGYSQLYSFGTLPGDSWSSQDNGLVRGPDGAFYGTGRLGGVLDEGMMFRMEKVVGSYSQICSFPLLSGGGFQPGGTPILASDGFFYGVTVRGGPLDGGSVFRFAMNGPCYNQIACQFAANEPQLRFSGTPGTTYQIQRTDTLASGSWATLTNITANANGLIEFQDDNAPPTQSFYRVAQP
jgi:uncharacterized repeat protein (TIGR03803 family)